MLRTNSSLSVNSALWIRASELSLSSVDSVSSKCCTNSNGIFGCDKRKNMAHYEACLFSTILEDVLSKLQILNQCNSGRLVEKTILEMDQHLNKKYGIMKSEMGDEQDKFEHKNIHSMQYTLQKLQNDRDIIFNVLKETYLDMSKHKQFNFLTKHVKDKSIQQENPELLKYEEGRNRETKRELSKQLRHQRNHIKSILYQTEARIDNLTRRFEDAALYSSIRGRYVDNWQQARHEQLNSAIRDKEFAPLRNIGHHKLKWYQEQRVHSEIDMLTNIIINETLDKVQSWITKYENDIEKIDLKIQVARSDWTDMQTRRIDLEEKFAKHAEEMQNWIKFKDDRERARLYREKMNNSAITIQAWWRGLLVRNKLGPYKVSKKQDKKKKK